MTRGRDVLIHQRSEDLGVQGVPPQGPGQEKRRRKLPGRCRSDELAACVNGQIPVLEPLA